MWSPADPDAPPPPRLTAFALTVGLSLCSAGVGLAVGLSSVETSAPLSATPAMPRLETPPSAQPATVPATGRVDYPLEVAALLRARERAVRERDLRAWMATVDPGAVAFRQRQRQAFANLMRLPVQTLRYRPLPRSEGQPVAPGAGSVPYVVTYRFAGYDRSVATTRTVFTYVRREGGWLIHSDTDRVSHTGHLDGADRGDGAGRTDGAGRALATIPAPWELGIPVRAVEGERVLVVGADGSRLHRWALQADKAVRAVDRVWGTRWSRGVVVLVPRTQQQLERLLDVPAGFYDRIAAIAIALDSPSSERPPQRVVVNPALLGDAAPADRRVILTHEMVHVATRSYAAQEPIWLAEGFADYVAYLHVDIPVVVGSGGLLGAVRAGELPDSLPVRSDFHPRRGQLARAYWGSWIAARLIVEEHGRPALVSLYRRLHRDAEVSVDRVFREELGTSRAGFVRDWRAELRRLAR